MRIDFYGKKDVKEMLKTEKNDDVLRKAKKTEKNRKNPLGYLKPLKAFPERPDEIRLQSQKQILSKKLWNIGIRKK